MKVRKVRDKGVREMTYKAVSLFRVDASREMGAELLREIDLRERFRMPRSLCVGRNGELFLEESCSSSPNGRGAVNE